MGRGGLGLAGQVPTLDCGGATMTGPWCACACTCACGWPSARGRAHLGLDLLGRVGKEDGGVGVAGAHLGLGPLQGGEEGRVQQGWFRIADPGGDVPRHPEVRVLWGEGSCEGGWKKRASFQPMDGT